MEERKPRGLCISTRCHTLEELVAKLSADCDDSSIFINSTSLRAVASEAPFVIVLADKSVAMRGWSRVVDAWPTRDNRFGRPGMQLAITRLQPASAQLFARMIANRSSTLAARRASTPVSVVLTTPTSIGMPPIARPPRRPSIQIPPLAVALPQPTKPTKPTKPIVADGTPTEPLPISNRLPPVLGVLPANPLCELTDASLAGFVECHLYEDHSIEAPPPTTPMIVVEPEPAELVPNRRPPPLPPPPSMIVVEPESAELVSNRRPPPPPLAPRSVTEPLLARWEPSWRLVGLVAIASIASVIASIAW